MEKEDIGKVEGAVNGTDKEAKDIFDSQYDPIQGRVSYKSEYRDHCHGEFAYIAGILDMLFLINEGDQWHMRGENIAYVILDARNRAEALRDIL